MRSILIIGGDKRQTCLKEFFKAEGYICEHIYSADNISLLKRMNSFDTVMLPLPVTKDKEYIYTDSKELSVNLKDVIGKLTDKQLLVGGSFDKVLAAYLKERKIRFFDFFEREDLIIYNAYLTAQGALKLLLDSTEELLLSKKVLITGFGRVGKAVAQIMKNNGTDVYVAARNKAQLTEAECSGYKTIEITHTGAYLYLFDYIFNTVPFNIFTREDILHFKGKYFELASKPYGTDREFFKEKRDFYIDGAALPGKFLAYSSAKIIAKTTLEHINSGKGGD